MSKSFQRSASRCMLCQSEQLEAIVELPQMPVFCNVLWPTWEEATAAPRGDIYLSHCSNCDHVYNTVFDPTLVEYRPGYENSLHFSDVFQAYAQDLAQALVDRYDLRQKKLIEIGCGQGNFLRLLCELGYNRGLGFDPSLAPNLLGGAGNSQLRFIADAYSEEYAHLPADMIYARHVLEHLENPEELLTTVKRALGAQIGGILFIEVPNAIYTFEKLGLWDIIYEHPSYFSPRSLQWLFDHCGFQVLELRSAYAEQYLVAIAALQSRKGEQEQSDVHLKLTALQIPSNYAEIFHQKIDSWKAYLARLSEQGRRVVIWGGGSKGVTFLNLLRDPNLVKYVVDINPGKLGKFIPVSGQEIIPPEFLQEYHPDIVIVMNPVYQNEINRKLDQLGVQAESISL